MSGDDSFDFDETERHLKVGHGFRTLESRDQERARCAQEIDQHIDAQRRSLANANVKINNMLHG